MVENQAFSAILCIFVGLKL